MIHRIRAAAALSCLLSVGCATTVWPVEAYAPDPAATEFTYDDFDRCLERYVDDQGRVDYAALDQDPQALERFYAQVAAISPSTHPALFPDEAHEFAYWINAYNAAVLRLVLANHPIDSVNDVSPPAAWFFVTRQGAGFFYFQKVVVGGQAISLYDLERDLILARYPEPRAHFALNCASNGCPRLPRRHFDPARLDEELTREARRFFAEERNLRIDHGSQTVHLSQILEWYESEFVEWLVRRRPERPATLLEYAAVYADDETAAELRGRACDYTVEFVPYDWGLNRPRPGS